MISKCNFNQCGCQNFLLGEKIGGTFLHTTCRHMIDHHDSTSFTTPLANPNDVQSYVVNPANPHFHSTSLLDCTAAPNLFCTPVAPAHTPIIYGVTHKEVMIGNPTN